MKLFRIPALLLALVIQVAPLCRTASLSPAISSSFAIIMRWVVGGTLAAGAYDACSGASTYFTCPTSATGNVAQAFTYYITLANIGSDPGAKFAASPLPYGLTVSNHDKVPVHGVIYGIPTTPTNNLSVKLVASYPGQPSVMTNVTFWIRSAPTAALPAITTQPSSASVVAGRSASFSVTAAGTGLGYRWRRNGQPLAGADASTLTLNNVLTSQAGDYSAVVTNSSGAVTSAPASLTVTAPASPTITLLPSVNSRFQFSFAPIMGLTNTVLAASDPAAVDWTTLTNLPPPSSSAPVMISDAIPANSRFYRVRVQP